MSRVLASQLIRIHVVCERTGLSRSDIHNRVQRGTFPAPALKLPRAHLWDPVAVDRWLAADIAARAREI